MAVGIESSSLYSQKANVEDGWQNLKRVGHKTALNFVLRDGVCHGGNISDAGDDSVHLTTSGKPLLLWKADILRVGETGDAHNVIYSGRSSWQDALDANPQHAESAVVALKDGHGVSGKSIGGDEHSILIKNISGKHSIAKGDVSSIRYIRQMPLTDGQEYLRDEAPYLLLFTPDAYVRMMGISSKLSVLLYDASKPEDNSKIECLKKAPVLPAKE